MKQILITMVIILLIAACLTACKKQSQEQSEPISYMQQSLYTASSANYRVTVTSGRSESLFVADGKVTDVQDYATVTVVPLHVDLYNGDYTYTLTGSTGTAQGTMVKDNFGASFEAQIDDWDNVGIPTTLTITSGDKSEEFALIDRMDGCITGLNAHEIAYKTVQDKLDADDKDREIYVRFINDSSTPDSPYYWYVAYIHAPTDYYSVLIDPTSGTVLNVTP